MSQLSFGAVLFLSMVAAALPAVAYALLVWRLDLYEREPLHLVLAVFLWGAVPAAIAAAIIGTILSAPLTSLPQHYYDIASASLVAPPVEETVKGLALLGLFMWVRSEFDDVLDGVIYGSLVGFGFAMTENVLYFLGNRDTFSQFATIIFGRAIAFGFNHAMFTSFTGAAFGLAIGLHGRGKKLLVVALGWGAAVTAHFAHNFLLTAGNVCLPSLLLDWAGVVVIFAIVVLSWWRERKVIASELAEEMRAGVLTVTQYDDVRSRYNRTRQAWRAMGASGARQARLWRQLVDGAVELAFAKRRLRRDKPGSQEAVVTLRRHVLHLRQALGDPEAAATVACASCARPLPPSGVCPFCTEHA
jgi:RsiW-degrading membrane proteinase PrsW (M82 family)